MELTTDAVRKILLDSLFKENEDHSKSITAEGITATFHFHPERLESHRVEVLSLLKELPIEFMEKTGGGMTFLNGCIDKNGSQWGEQMNVQELMVLGIGLGLAEYCLPRDMWSVLPGGMPYFMVKGE